MTKLQQAEKIAKHYTDMFNLASSINYSIERLDSNELNTLDRDYMQQYIIYCADEIKKKHLKDFGIKLKLEDENEKY